MPLFGGDVPLSVGLCHTPLAGLEEVGTASQGSVPELGAQGLDVLGCEGVWADHGLPTTGVLE